MLKQKNDSELIKYKKTLKENKSKKKILINKIQKKKNKLKKEKD